MIKTIIQAQQSAAKDKGKGKGATKAGATTTTTHGGQQPSGSECVGCVGVGACPPGSSSSSSRIRLNPSSSYLQHIHACRPEPPTTQQEQEQEEHQEAGEGGGGAGGQQQQGQGQSTTRAVTPASFASAAEEHEEEEEDEEEKEGEGQGVLTVPAVAEEIWARRGVAGTSMWLRMGVGDSDCGGWVIVITSRTLPTPPPPTLTLSPQASSRACSGRPCSRPSRSRCTSTPTPSCGYARRSLLLGDVVVWWWLRTSHLIQSLPHHPPTHPPNPTACRHGMARQGITKLLSPEGAFSLRANLVVGYLAEVVHLPLTVPLEVRRFDSIRESLLSASSSTCVRVRRRGAHPLTPPTPTHRTTTTNNR